MIDSAEKFIRTIHLENCKSSLNYFIMTLSTRHRTFFFVTVPTWYQFSEWSAVLYIFLMSLGKILNWKQLFSFLKSCDRTFSHISHIHSPRQKKKNLSEFPNWIHVHLLLFLFSSGISCPKIIISVRCDIGILWNKRVKWIDKKKKIRWKLSRLIFTNSGRVFSPSLLTKPFNYRIYCFC